MLHELTLKLKQSKMFSYEVFLHVELIIYKAHKKHLRMREKASKMTIFHSLNENTVQWKTLKSVSTLFFLTIILRIIAIETKKIINQGIVYVFIYPFILLTNVKNSTIIYMDDNFFEFGIENVNGDKPSPANSNVFVRC